MASSIPEHWAKVNMAKSMLVLALSICFMISISGPCSGAKTGLMRILASLKLGRPGFVAFVQIAEGAAAEPIELLAVLVDRVLTVQHHHVVDVVADLGGVRHGVGASVGQREVGRACEHGGAVRAVVADDELLVKDRRVEVGDHVDPGPEAAAEAHRAEHRQDHAGDHSIAL
jgi:hypothetical protein